MTILTQDATTAQVSSINFPANCSSCPHWQQSDRTPNVGDCPVHDLKTFGTDRLREICREALAEIGAIEESSALGEIGNANSKKGYRAKTIASASVVAEWIEPDAALENTERHNAECRAQVIASLENALHLISLEITRLINLGARPGCIVQYHRRDRPNPGHNWEWTENGVLKKKFVKAGLVGQYKTECNRGSEVQEWKRRSRDLQEQIALLRKGGAA